MPETAKDLLTDDRWRDDKWRSLTGQTFFEFVAAWCGTDWASQMWADAIALDTKRATT